MKIAIFATILISLGTRTRPTQKLMSQPASRVVISLERDVFFAGRESLTPVPIVEPFYMINPQIIEVYPCLQEPFRSYLGRIMHLMCPASLMGLIQSLARVGYSHGISLRTLHQADSPIRHLPPGPLMLVDRQARAFPLMYTAHRTLGHERAISVTCDMENRTAASYLTGESLSRWAYRTMRRLRRDYSPKQLVY